LLPHEKPLKNESATTAGPGSHDPYKPNEIAASKNKSHNKLGQIGKLNFGTFASSGERGTPVAPSDVRDYNPNHNRIMSWSARFTHRKSDSEGKGGFGSQTARVLHLEGAYNGMPNGAGFKMAQTPSAYDAKVDEKGRSWEMHSVAEIEKGHTSAAFASTSKQRQNVVLPSADVPGPGAYYPNDACTIEHLPGANPESNIVSKVGRDGRYSADTLDPNVDRQTPPQVGPGSYDPKVTNDGQLSTVRATPERACARRERFGRTALLARRCAAAVGTHDAGARPPTRVYAWCVCARSLRRALRRSRSSAGRPPSSLAIYARCGLVGLATTANSTRLELTRQQRTQRGSRVDRALLGELQGWRERCTAIAVTGQSSRLGLSADALLASRMGIHSPGLPWRQGERPRRERPSGTRRRPVIVTASLGTQTPFQRGGARETCTGYRIGPDRA
jgi:hypothetical protein